MEEKIQYWDTNLLITPLSEKDKPEIAKFSCGSEELDSFFHQELYMCVKHHYVSAYCGKDKKDGEIVALFTLANDAVVIDNVDREDFIDTSCDKISEEYIPIFERQTSFPAINIGHLGVKSGFQRQGIGECIIDFILYTFTHYEMSGCQFITVDSLNNSDTNKFYIRNNFTNQTNSDMSSLTRRMYLPIQIYFDDFKFVKDE